MAAEELTSDLIDNLDPEDVDPALDLLEAYGIDTEGVESVTDAQRKLREHLSAKFKDADGEDQTQVIGAIKNVIETDLQQKKTLQTVLFNAKKFTDKIPNNIAKGVEQVFENVKEQMRKNNEDLENTNPVILIAGETSAGKSSLLNLLLGEIKDGFVPVSHLAATSVICELKYGEKKSMIAHPVDETAKPEKILLSDDAAQKLSDYIHQKDDRDVNKFEYNKVEIFWPCEWLAGGITIVDSPGVGESEELTEMVKQYVPKASAFIYVINTPNAGGIQPDRLQSLLFSKIEENKETDEVNLFNPASAIFVCNKWDQVPAKEKDDVKELIMKKLHQIWPKFSEDQVFFISVKQTMESLQANQLPSGFQDLLHGINRLIPIGLKTVLIRPYLTAVKIIQRCNLELKSYLARYAKTEDKLEDIGAIMAQLRRLEHRPRELIESLKKEMDKDVMEGLEFLKQHLSSPETKERLKKWHATECPTADKELERLQEMKAAYATRKIQKEINDWDNQTRQFEMIQDRIMAKFHDDYTDLENQLHRQELKLMGKKPDSVTASQVYEFNSNVSSTAESSPTFTKKQKVLVGVTTPLWVPLGLVVGIVALPAFGVKRLWQKQKDKKKVKDYEKNKEKEMADTTELILDAWIEHDQVKEIVYQRFNKMMEELEGKTFFMENWIKADKDLASSQKEVLREHIPNLKELDVMQNLYDDGVYQEGQLHFIYACQLRTYNLEMSEFDNMVKIGEGTYAVVHKAKWTPEKGGKSKTVALKTLADCLTMSNGNATDFIVEEQNLKMLMAKNVVTFYGSLLQKLPTGLHPVMVMEYLDKDLFQVVNSPNYNAPADCGTQMLLRQRTEQTSDYVNQICMGLHAIHKSGFLHRDLKLENIMMTNNGIVKLADLGLAKPMSHITGSLVGTPLYIAPEVWTQQKYSEMADIFSLGIVMWEIWYGKDIGTRYNDPTHAQDLPKFRAKPYLDGVREPHPIWKSIMERAWKSEPKFRPTARECIELMTPFVTGDL